MPNISVYSHQIATVRHRQRIEQRMQSNTIFSAPLNEMATKNTFFSISRLHRTGCLLSNSCQTNIHTHTHIESQSFLARRIASPVPVAATKSHFFLFNFLLYVNVCVCVLSNCQTCGK